MSAPDAAFVGSVPESYDRHLASILFTPYAEDLEARGVTAIASPAAGSGPRRPGRAWPS